MSREAGEKGESRLCDRIPLAPHSEPDARCLHSFSNGDLLLPNLDSVGCSLGQQENAEVSMKAEQLHSDTYPEDDALVGEFEFSDEEDAIRGLSSLPVELDTDRRALCTRCRRPQKVCLCPFLPEQPLPVSTCLYIVQHPAEVQLKSSLSSQYVIRTQPTNMCLSTLECAAVALSIMERNAEIQETILRPLQAMCTFQLQHGAQIHHSKEHLIKMGLYAKQMPKNKRKLKKMQFMVDNVKI
uniref:tRNA-uridine aminocarboxypropyltransferase n=1 Tax=Leptobrachium leishanense TaxID=445787 RepID=A0A8C5MBC6_9ANUR